MSNVHEEPATVYMTLATAQAQKNNLSGLKQCGGKQEEGPGVLLSPLQTPSPSAKPSEAPVSCPQVPPQPLMKSRAPLLTYETLLLIIRDAQQQLQVGVTGIRSHQLDKLLPSGFSDHKLCSLLFLQQVEGLYHLAALHVSELSDLILEGGWGFRQLQAPFL